MTYDYDHVQELASKPWPKFRPESDLIPKKLAEHMAKGYRFIN